MKTEHWLIAVAVLALVALGAAAWQQTRIDAEAALAAAQSPAGCRAGCGTQQNAAAREVDAPLGADLAGNTVQWQPRR